MEHLLNSCFYYNYFTPIFSNLYFLELLFLVGDKKINKIYQSKLKSADSRDKFTTHATSKIDFFLILVNVVN